MSDSGAPRIVHAYDVLIEPRDVGQIAEHADHGWVFGLPRGIATGQWPLDPLSGWPLMHGFTLLLPPDYRCHGPEIAGLAFFATAADQSDGGGDAASDMVERILARPVHPRTHRMTDILDYHYAVVLLTLAELNGAQARPPEVADTLGSRPQWLDRGADAAYTDIPYMHDALGGTPGSGIAWHRALRWRPRATDPNAGKAPMEDFGDSTSTGYVSYLDPENGYDDHKWAKDHEPIHIGGTMRPIQGEPEMSPYHIGFEEWFGGYNFGSGNAQLDFKRTIFDWAQ